MFEAHGSKLKASSKFAPNEVAWEQRWNVRRWNVENRTALARGRNRWDLSTKFAVNWLDELLKVLLKQRVYDGDV